MKTSYNPKNFAIDTTKKLHEILRKGKIKDVKYLLDEHGLKDEYRSCIGVDYNGYNALELVIAINHNGSHNLIINKLKELGAKIGKISCQKLYDNIKDRALLEALLDNVTPKQINDFLKEKPELLENLASNSQDLAIELLQKLDAKIGKITWDALYSAAGNESLYKMLLGHIAPEEMQNFLVANPWHLNTLVKYFHNIGPTTLQVLNAMVAFKGASDMLLMSMENQSMFETFLDHRPSDEIRDLLVQEPFLLERFVKIHRNATDDTIIEKLRQFGAKTNPSAAELHMAYYNWFNNKKLLLQFLQDADEKAINDEIASSFCHIVPQGKYTLLELVLKSLDAKDHLAIVDNARELLDVLLSSGRLHIGQTITTGQAQVIADAINAKDLIEPVGCMVDAKPEVRAIIDGACKLTQAKQDAFFDQCGGILYNYMHLSSLLFDQLVAPEHHVGEGMLIIDGYGSQQ